MKKLILSAFAILLLISSCHKEPEFASNTMDHVFTTQNLPAASFTISTDRDTILRGKSGTQVFVRKNTFLDSHGNNFSGKVSLELKEALTSCDMVLGNMTTVTNGNTLQTGGMIYLSATADHELLSINQNAPIQLSVPTQSKKESMQIYSAEFDSVSNQFNWLDPQDLMIRVSPQTDSLPFAVSPEKKPVLHHTTAHATINNLSVPVPPAKPEQFDNRSDTTLSLIFDTAAFPEFAQYRNVKFKVHNDKTFNMEDSKQVWYSMDLKKTNQEGIYIISFGGFKNNKSISKSYRVSPVFTGKDYALAMKEYTARFEQFENKKKEIEAQRIEEERQQKIAAEKVKAEWAKQQAEWAKQQVQWKNQQELIRTANTNPFSSDPSTSYIFSVNKLGWANIDRLYSNPATKEVEFTTIVQRQQDYNSISITMLFDKEQIYLPGYQKKDLTFGFTHADYEKPKLPVGETATIIVTGYMDGRLNYAMEKVTISEKQTVVLKMQQTTEKELKALVEARI